MDASADLKWDEVIADRLCAHIVLCTCVVYDHPQMKLLQELYTDVRGDQIGAPNEMVIVYADE